MYPICDAPEGFFSAEEVARQLHEDCNANVEAIIGTKSACICIFESLKDFSKVTHTYSQDLTIDLQ